MKYLIVYYSATGNNKYVAEKIAQQLECDIVEIVPRAKSHFILILSSLIGIKIGNRKLKVNIGEYDKVIVCCPIWMGKVIAPIRAFLKENETIMKKLIYVTCCGGDEQSKNTKYGYENMFSELKKELGNVFEKGYAIPIGLLVEKEKRKETDLMKIILSDSNYGGEIKKRVEEIVNEIRE